MPQTKSILMCAHINIEFTGKRIRQKCKYSLLGYKIRDVFRCLDCGLEFTANDLIKLNKDNIQAPEEGLFLEIIKHD